MKKKKNKEKPKRGGRGNNEKKYKNFYPYSKRDLKLW